MLSRLKEGSSMLCVFYLSFSIRYPLLIETSGGEPFVISELVILLALSSHFFGYAGGFYFSSPSFVLCYIFNTRNCSEQRKPSINIW